MTLLLSRRPQHLRRQPRPCPLRIAHGHVLRTVWVLATLAGTTAAHAGLGFDEALRIARDQAPALLAQQQALASAQALQPAVAALPAPRLSLGVENLPISGADRGSLTRDFMTMQRIGLMQDVPNRAKRDARSALAQARAERERALLTAAQLAVRRETALAWIGLHYAQRRAQQLGELERENRLLVDTLDARVAAGRAMPADRSMARQETLMLADRADELQRDIDKARAGLRRWVGVRADEPLDGDAPAFELQAAEVRAGLHRHAEIAPYEAMQAMARAETDEASAERRGDWSWELAYSKRGAQYGDMVSFAVKFDLPWGREQRNQPQIEAKRIEQARIAAERDDTLRRHAEEVQAQLAELAALDAQRERLAGPGFRLAQERVALTLAAYQAGRGDLAMVLSARRDAAETRLRLIDLDSQRHALRVRLSTLIAE